MATKKKAAPSPEPEVATSEPQADIKDIVLSLEQVVAAIISQHQPVRVTVETLIQDFSNKQIRVDQDEDGLIFQLVDVKE